MSSPSTHKRKRSKHNIPKSPPPQTPHHTMCFIGQAPGPTAKPPYPPFPDGGIAANRLAKLAGMEATDLYTRADRFNIFNFFPGTKPPAAIQGDVSYRKHQSVGDVFNLANAKKEATLIDITKYHLVVLLGLNVAKAFQLKQPSLFQRHYIDHQLKITPVNAIVSRPKKKKKKNPLNETEEEDKDDDKKKEEQKKKWNGESTLVLVYPHPSGVSHYWNSRANRSKATNELRKAMVDCGIVRKTESKFFQDRNSTKSKYFENDSIATSLGES